MCARADRERAANRLVRKPDRKARKITAMLVRTSVRSYELRLKRRTRRYTR